MKKNLFKKLCVAVCVIICVITAQKQYEIYLTKKIDEAIEREIKIQTREMVINEYVKFQGNRMAEIAREHNNKIINKF